MCGTNLHEKEPISRLVALSLATLCALSSSPGARAGDPVSPPEPLSPFGIGSDAKHQSDYPAWIPMMSAIGITNIRNCGVGWRGVEPQDGTWNFDKLDAQLKILDDNKMTGGGTLQGWSSKAQRGTLPLYDLPGWSVYVSGVVKHAKDKIKYWEVWNEPPNGTHNATGADYGKVVAATYDAAKASDPSSLIGMAAKSVHVNYLEQAIKGGAKDHFDYISLHPYETLGCATKCPGAEPVFMSIVPTVRKMLAAQDPSRVNVPIIFTELGYEAKKPGADLLQGNNLVKAYTMGIAEGVYCIQWFEGMDGDSGAMGLLEASGTKRPSYIAMGQMIQNLGEHPTYLGWVLLNDKDYGFVFQGAKGTVMSTWAPKGKSDRLAFTESAQIVEPLTGKSSAAKSYALTDTPILVVGVPADLVTQATANKSKPFPWGGDYTNAKSVSITMDGNKVLEKGLHTQAGESIQSDIIAYGGSARAGNGIHGGNVYMVDPNFLSYSQTPIEISVVVRRDQSNMPSKLGLEYESTTGFKKATPFDVPDKNDWSTATWKINDAEFVSMYGFNFRFDAGRYFVQSVTVTKLDN